MTYGTYSTIKQALEALNLRESVIISLVDGEVHIFDKEDYIDTIKDELRDEIYDEAYDNGYSDGYSDGDTFSDVDSRTYDEGYDAGYRDGRFAATVHSQKE